MKNIDSLFEEFQRRHLLTPDDSQALNNLTIAAFGIWSPAAAKRLLRCALALDGFRSRALRQWGIIARRSGEDEAAIGYFKRAICADPENFLCAEQGAQTWKGRFDFRRAEMTLRWCRTLDPTAVVPQVDLGVIQAILGQSASARRSLEDAFDSPSMDASMASEVIAMLDYLPSPASNQAQILRKRWDARFGGIEPTPRNNFSNSQDPNRRLRVGYVSADFHYHSATSVFRDILLNHDKSRFKIFLYSNGATEDDETRLLQRNADCFFDITELSDADFAARVPADRVDILVDLSGHSPGNRLTVFARRLAPVQVSAWGYALGTGLRAMDYFLTDAVAVPEIVRRDMAEICVDLPCMIPFSAPEGAPPPAVPGTFAPRPITFGCFNRLSKITDEILAVWGALLAEMVDAELILKNLTLGNHKTRELFRERAAKAGIDTDRLKLEGPSSRFDHLARYRDIDVTLDTFPHTGGVTTWESLYMGVPVVSKIGEAPVTRLSASILHSIGLPEWCVETDDAYIEVAIALARKRSETTLGGSRLREQILKSPGLDKKGYTRAVEEAYQRMWRSWCDAKPLAPRQ